MPDTQERLLEFIKAKLLRGKPGLTADSPISGMLGSLALVTVLVFIEKELRVSIPIEEFVTTKFDTVAAIARFVDSHRPSESTP